MFAFLFLFPSLRLVPPARYAMLARDEKKKKKKREQRVQQASKETTLRPRDKQADRGASIVLLFFSILLHHLACAFSLFSATELPGLGRSAGASQETGQSVLVALVAQPCKEREDEEEE